MKTIQYFFLCAAFFIAACGEKTQTSNVSADSEKSTEFEAVSTIKIDKEHIDATLSGLVNSEALVAASALVFVDGEEKYFGAFGKADRENDQAMQRDTIVQLFSMTKPITGVALMTLYEQGKFKLDDPIEKYAPEFANLRVYAGMDDNDKPIYEAPGRLPTIRDIMRHTAGFSSGGGDTIVEKLYREANPMAKENTLPEMAEKLGGVPLLYQPGSRWLYGPSVDVQAFLVERISGTPYDEYLQTVIFDPLQMNDTQYVVSGEKLKRFARLYDRNEDGTFTRMPDDRANTYNTADWPLKRGGSGLTSTLDNYMRFAQMLVNRGELNGVRILSPDSINIMSTDAMPEAITDKSWLPNKGQVGFGIDFAVRIAAPANAEEASGEIGEFFWDGAANTVFWVDPVNNLTAVLFTQYRPFGNVPLHKSFRDAVYHTDETASALLLHPSH